MWGAIFVAQDILVLLFLITLVLFFGKDSLLLIWNSSTSKRRIPGPFSVPLLGTRWIYSNVGGYSFNKIHELYSDLFQKYGNIFKEETLFNIPIINIKEKDDIEKVLKSSGKYPVRPPTEAIMHYRKSRPDRYASGGLVNEQGITWYDLRSNLTTELTSTHTITNFIPQIDEIVSDWCNLIKQQNGVVKDLKPLAVRLGLEMTCALILGRRMGFLISDGFSLNAQRLYEAVHHHFLACRDTYYGLPIWKLWVTPSYHRLMMSEDAIYNLALELIESADEETQESRVFQSVLHAPIDSREKTAAIVDFIAAGIYTLANTVVFLLHLIGANASCQQKLYNDIEMGSTNYLRACINENFRLIPTAFCLARIAEKDLELSGYNIKAGSVLLCHTGLACRDSKNFNHADEFIPDRWLDDGKAKNMSTATFLLTPFGVGRRICPGRRFVEQVLSSLLAEIVRQFKIVSMEKLELDFEFILAPSGLIPMKFVDRTL